MVLATFSYISRVLVDLTDAELQQIGRASEQYNSEHGVTGLLLFDGTHFAQIIEESLQALSRVRGRIMHDPRHELEQVGPELAIAARQFSGWSLRIVDNRPAPVAGTIERQSDESLGFRVHPELVSFFRSSVTPGRD